MAGEESVGRSAKFQPTITFVEDTPPRKPRLDLNRATVKDLTTLPGIGDATARKIIRARKTRAFTHVDDVVTAHVVSSSVLDKIRDAVSAQFDDRPNLHTLSTKPERILAGKAFQLLASFDDSALGARLVRLQADSVSHSIDVTREVSASERRQGRIAFDLPAMESGVMNVQITLYDNGGGKDYLARTLHILHNPPIVVFWPSERSLRLSRGAALMQSDGKFRCATNFYFYNGTSSTVTLSRNATRRVTSQTGSLLETGGVTFPSNITLQPGQVSTGWWWNIAFPPNNVVHNKLKAKQWIRIRYQFTQIGTGTTVADSLTWRAVLGPNVNIIRVGEENFTSADKTRIFNALRNTAGSSFQLQDMDIGTIRTWHIKVADAGGYLSIDSHDEAKKLTQDFYAPTDGIDMFVVLNYFGSTIGYSPVGGPCTKSGKGMRGNVVQLQSSQQMLGLTMAHEHGHYLGLGHSTLSSNVMRATISSANTNFTGSQGTTMKKHCFIRFLG